MDLQEPARVVHDTQDLTKLLQSQDLFYTILQSARFLGKILHVSSTHSCIICILAHILQVYIHIMIDYTCYPSYIMFNRYHSLTIQQQQASPAPQKTGRERYWVQVHRHVYNMHVYMCEGECLPIANTLPKGCDAVGILILCVQQTENSYWEGIVSVGLRRYYHQRCLLAAHVLPNWHD